ncbi:MAG: hypothetical protein K0S33_3171 [Bacteroidetes bacterium]|nr:hypothetical protein [Bacteroidota bacterium]
MELLIKQYQDRASRIGIKYSSRYPAVKPFEELLTKYPDESFRAKIEVLHDKIHLTLQPDTGGGNVFYRDLVYKKELLPKINAIMNSGLPIELVHVYFENNVPTIAKAFYKNRFVKISGVELIGQYAA